MTIIDSSLTMSSPPQQILAQLQTVGSAYAQNKPGAREQLLNLSHALISSLELPSEAIQRMGWAEVGRRLDNLVRSLNAAGCGSLRELLTAALPSSSKFSST